MGIEKTIRLNGKRSTGFELSIPVCTKAQFEIKTR